MGSNVRGSIFVGRAFLVKAFQFELKLALPFFGHFKFGTLSCKAGFVLLR